jgi:hypothetical protein
MSANNGKIQGVICAFSFGCLSGSKRDPTITAEVIESKHAESDAGSWSNKLFPAKTCNKTNSFTKLRKHLGGMRAYVYNNTYVWEDSLWRILPERRIELFKQVVEIDGKQTAKELLEEFITDLPNLMDLARLGRGNAYKDSDYPSVDEIRQKYFYDVKYREIPTGQGLNPALMAEAIRDIEELHQQRLEEANTALIQRLIVPFQTLAEQMKDPQQRKVAPILETIKELADAVPSMDLTNNQELRTLAGQLSATFAELKPELVRKDEQMQKNLGQLAENTIVSLQRFGSLGRKFA